VVVRHDDDVKSAASRQVLLAVLVVALVVLAWLVVRVSQGPPDAQGRASSAAPSSFGARDTRAPSGATSGATSPTDPVSGLPWVAESALPPEARDTLALIRAGGPFPYPRNDDKTFANREGLLPKKVRGYYREFTVVTPGSDDRGTRRLITGSDGEIYWTDDHYASFHRVKEAT
jgi:guanyl-specific ribonuclease Sa